MFDLIKLALIAAAIAAVVGFAVHEWNVFKDSIGQPYAEAQRKADEPVLAQAKADVEAAQLAAQHARDDTRACIATTQRQIDQVNAWKAEAAARKQEAVNAKAKAEQERKANAPYVTELERRAAAQPKLLSCEKERDQAKCVLANQLRKQRGLPLAQCDS